MSVEKDSYRLLRIAFGAVAVLSFLTVSPFRDLFYGSESLCPSEHFSFSPWVVTIIWWAGLVAAVCILFGRLYRVASVLVYLALLYFFRTPCRPDNYGDQIFAGLAFLALLAPAPGKDGGPWLHRTLRLYAGTLYLIPLLHRFGGEQWWNGTAAWTALADPTTSRIWSSLSRDPWGIPTWVYFGITWGSMAFEGLFPFLIWVRRLRLPLVIAGLVFHAAMGLVLDLGLFPLQMAVVLIGCLGDDVISLAPRRQAPPLAG